MDGRRHSVDVPISRALIALRRVRSLRDPSTNSMSKLSALIDNLNWETVSNNGITLGFEDGCCNGDGGGDVREWRNSTHIREEEQHVSDHELYYGPRRCDSNKVSPFVLSRMVRNKGLAPHRSLEVENSDSHLLDLDMTCDDRASCDKGLDLVHTAHPCIEQDKMLVQAVKRRCGRTKHEVRRENLDDPSRVTAGDVLSRAGSPYTLIDKTPKEGLNHGIALYRNSDVGMMDFCHHGCGISSCWLRTMKSKESNLLPDDEQPLMLGNADQLLANRNSTDWKVAGEGTVESPRSFCQKFMPKSFNELLGQKTVATSLMNAIDSRQIASLYVFHGPRGTGKTSAARIFAAALNCLSSEIGRPCGSCQECVLFFSGRSRDVKEVDSVRINRRERRRLLVKNARIPPVFCRFKVYIVDECHLLHRETWATILNSLEELPEQVVFVMTTPNLDKLPSSVISKSQRFHFQNVKAVDIASQLGKICLQEGLDYDPDALNFIATKSNGSLRDAEMMLDQLSLLGKKITVSLVYEVNGFVSNDELLDLLHLALSSDASNTVKKARELLGSRTDPLQLVSQLANLIMDILAGKCPDGVSEVRRKLFATNNSEADLQQLSYALKVLLQTEKQLRVSKNQTTWLTAALLQLSSTGSTNDVGDVRLSVRSLGSQDGDYLSTSSTCESMKHRVDVESAKTGMQNDKGDLQLVWTRATGMCASSSLRKFLQKRVKLVSVHLNQGIAVAELEFDSPEHASKAEKSWKVIASALQHVLGYNVELRINLAQYARKESKKLYFIRLFSCSRKAHLRSHFCTACESNASRSSDATHPTLNKYVEACSSDCTSSQISHPCCHGKDLFKTIRCSHGNALSIGASTPCGSIPDNTDREDLPFHKRIDNGCLNAGNPSPKKENSKFRCWRTAMFPFRKAWQQRHQQRNEQLMDYALHCASAN